MRIASQKVLVVFGTRPEAIKLAPVILALRQHSTVEVSVCTTGQHKDMVGGVCEFFGTQPDFDLDIMQPGQTLDYVAGAILRRLPEIFRRVQPDLVIVQGDTATAFAAATSAFFHRIKVAHVEAGLRTWDLAAPWPEEGFRAMVGRIADYHFAPTERAYRNLQREAVQGQLLVTGNTVVDAALVAARKLEGLPGREIALKLGLSATAPRKTILFTMHRRESFGAPLERVLRAIDDIAREQDVDILFPVHPNPNVTEPANRIMGGNPNVRLLDPLSYDELIFTLQTCSIVVTDSGGIAEEAPTFRKPAVILRDTTERPECVECGNAVLVGQDVTALKRLVTELLAGGDLYQRMSCAPNPFGDGNASLRIADRLAGLAGPKVAQAA